MDLRPDEINYSGTVIRAWMGRDRRWWNVSIRWIGSGRVRRPTALTAWTHSDCCEQAWADGRELVDQVYWPNAEHHARSEAE